MVLKTSRYITVLSTIFLFIFGTCASTLEAQIDTKSFGNFQAQDAGGLSSVVTVTAHFTMEQNGQPAQLSVTANIQPGWYIYSISQPPGGPVATKIKLKPSDSYKLLGPFQPDSPPDRKKAAVFDNLTVESHQRTITWTAPIEFKKGIAPATVHIDGELICQPCDPKNCLPPRPIDFVAELNATFGSGSFVIAENEQLKQTTFFGAIILAFVGGFILNLMPCVLPVIGLKLLSFIQQAGHSRSHAFILNVWYSAGLLSVFMLLATLAVGLGLGWGQLFQFQGFNITLACVVFVMALSFFGVWEIPIPGFAGSAGVGKLSEREGALGAFFKGILTTVLATPCSAPFLASALTWAVTQPPSAVYAIFFSAGLGMASPYLVIGAFPQLLDSIPKSGDWMETFKQIMGFILLGTTVFVLTFISPPLLVPTVGLLFGLWAACWWIGRVSPSAEPTVKIRAWVGAIAFSGLVWLITFIWLAPEMHDRFIRALGKFEKSETADHELPWVPFSKATLQKLKSEGKTILIDFSADWCMTCKTLEKLVLNTTEVKRKVTDNDVATLYADWTNDDPEVTEMLEALGSKQVPVLAIFSSGEPNRPIVIRGGYTQQSLLEALDQAGPSEARIEEESLDLPEP